MSEPKKNTRWKCFHKQLEDISKAPAQAESLRFNWRKDDEWNERRRSRPEAECNKLFTVITKISNGKYAREKFEKKVLLKENNVFLHSSTHCCCVVGSDDASLCIYISYYGEGRTRTLNDVWGFECAFGFNFSTSHLCERATIASTANERHRRRWRCRHIRWILG